MKTVSIALIFLVLLASCSTLVRVETRPSDAVVKIDGKIGKTQKLSDAFWEEYDIIIEKDGYRTYRGTLEKEFKVGNFIGGFFIFFPWLFVYGPKPFQSFELDKE